MRFCFCKTPYYSSFEFDHFIFFVLLVPFNLLHKGSVILSKQQLQHRKFNTSYVSSRIDIEKKLSFSLNCRPNFNFLKSTSFFVFALFFLPTTKTKLFIRLFFFVVVMVIFKVFIPITNTKYIASLHAFTFPQRPICDRGLVIHYSKSFYKFGLISEDRRGLRK